MGWSFAIGFLILVSIVVVIARRAMQVTKLAHDGVRGAGLLV